jgi:hypothetical protein
MTHDPSFWVLSAFVVGAVNLLIVAFFRGARDEP